MTDLPPPPAPQFPPSAPVGARPGELLDRFLARLIDGILVGIVAWLLAIILITGIVFTNGSGYVAGAVSSVIFSALFLGYFAFMESSRGQTVGKQLMKLRVEGPQGGHPTMEQAIKRNIFMAVSLLQIIPVIGGLLSGVASLAAWIYAAVTINNDTVARQGWHDKFAGGTRVIKEG